MGMEIIRIRDIARAENHVEVDFALVVMDTVTSSRDKTIRCMYTPFVPCIVLISLILHTCDVLCTAYRGIINLELLMICTVCMSGPTLRSDDPQEDQEELKESCLIL